MSSILNWVEQEKDAGAKGARKTSSPWNIRGRGGEMLEMLKGAPSWGHHNKGGRNGKRYPCEKRSAGLFKK